MKNKLKVAIIGSVGIPANYGGFETFTDYLTGEISGRYDLTVYCSSKAYTEKRAEYKGAKLRYIPLKANGIQSVPYDMLSMLDALIHGTDVLLILGVGGCIILPLLRLFFRKRRFVVNIDGLEWKRAKWKPFIRKFLKFAESCAVHFADHAIADNKVITDYITSEYKKDGVLAEYGADHVKPRKAMPELQKKFPFTKQLYSFGVCRIEPENNVHIVLEAYRRSGKRLGVVGNWQNSEYGRKLFEEYSKEENITLLGPIYNPEELDYLRGNCILYLHGHSCGGTNPSLIEAMYLGRAIAAFDVNFNRETTENSSLYFHDAESLAEISEKAPEEFADHGRKMQEIAERRYTWKRIAGIYEDCFTGKIK